VNTFDLSRAQTRDLKIFTIAGTRVPELKGATPRRRGSLDRPDMTFLRSPAIAVVHFRARHPPTIPDNTEVPPVADLKSVELTKIQQLTGGRHSGAVEKKSMRREFLAGFE
jgi:hypothetical protein